MPKQDRQIFSVSKRFSEVNSILEKIPNKSEFICQAILEKYNKSGIEQDDNKLEEKIKSILISLIGEQNRFIENNPPKLSKMETLKNDSDESDYKNDDEDDAQSQENDEAENAMKSAISNW